MQVNSGLEQIHFCSGAWFSSSDCRYPLPTTLSLLITYGVTALSRVRFGQTKCTVFLNYPDLAVFHPRDKPAVNARFVLIYPGSLNKHQGLDVAVRACVRRRVIRAGQVLLVDKAGTRAIRTFMTTLPKFRLDRMLSLGLAQLCRYTAERNPLFFEAG